MRSTFNRTFLAVGTLVAAQLFAGIAAAAPPLGDAPLSLQPLHLTFYPRFAYVANEADATVSLHGERRNRAVTPQRVGGGGDGAPLRHRPSGKFAYVANSGSNNVSAYTIDAATGRSPPSARLPGGARVPPPSPSTPPASSPTWRSRLRQRLGLHHQRHAPGRSPASARPWRRGPARTPSASTPAASSPTWRITAPTTSRPTPSTPRPGLSPASARPWRRGPIPMSVSVDPSGRFAYVANSDSDNVSAYTINASTGALTSIGAAVTAGTVPSPSPSTPRASSPTWRITAPTTSRPTPSTPAPARSPVSARPWQRGAQPQIRHRRPLRQVRLRDE